MEKKRNVKKAKRISNRGTLKPPEFQKPEDLLYASIDAILSPVPYASSLFESLLASPLEIRRQKWEKEVTLIVNVLQNDHKMSLQELSKNQEFISVVLHATTIALKSHQQEKIKALSNAVINSAISNPDDSNEDFNLIYIRYIDELTPLHLHLLSFFVRNPALLKACKSYNDLFKFVRDGFKPVLYRDEFLLLCNELSGKALIRISPDLEYFDDMYHADSLLLESTDDKLPRIEVTEIGRKFLTFVSLQLEK